ncbi:aminotransferase class I/II-fold pyridoxal phosphate-dependent enzyme [Marinomonas sp. THO17]|uniref:aminotransferase class I/II-fold pyridoxal phosphate-dependent enzyme n=1 Tax=Marinomonas sp. THO17 TaxID=3149048 RepID=UPI00336BC07D
MSAILGATNLNAPSLSHGGDIEAWQRQQIEAQNWLDLSSACNREPWPIPNLKPELWLALPDQTALSETAAHYYGVHPTAITSGSQQIIEALPILKREALKIENKRVYVPHIGYQEHAFAWQKWGYEVIYYQQTSQLLNASWAVAVLIQPNNPSAEWTDQTLLDSLIQRAEQQGAWLVVDEAFVDVEPEQSVLKKFKQESWPMGLFVMRSVGKFFGLAGARVGFVFSHAQWQQSINNLIGPWPVSTASLHLVSLALQDTVWQGSARKQLLARQAAFIEKVLPKFNTIFDSQDYVLHPLFTTWQLVDQCYAEQVFAMLHQVGVHTRLGEGWIRVAMPAMTELAELNNSLVRLLKGAGGRELA